jgi:hypothetical protein
MATMPLNFLPLRIDVLYYPCTFHPPFSKGPYEYGVDLDVAFVNRCLKQIEGLALPYNGFAFREDRGTEDSASDVCTLYKARAFLVDLGE